MAKRKQEIDSSLPQATTAPRKSKKTKSQPAATSIQRECIICVEDLPLDDFPYWPALEHGHFGGVCRSCWRAHLDTQVQSKQTDQIRCPQCSLNLNESDIKAHASRETYSRYIIPIWSRLEPLSNNSQIPRQTLPRNPSERPQLPDLSLFHMHFRLHPHAGR